MIEIGFGLCAILSAAAIALGLTTGLTILPLGTGAITIALVLGAALIGHGTYRRLRRRHGNSHDLRTTGLMLATTGVTVLVALTLPALAGLLNLLKIGGFPIGLYAMGQGVLVLFVALLFAYARWQGRIDDADGT